jgi:hypothetical protein
MMSRFLGALALLVSLTAGAADAPGVADDVFGVWEIVANGFHLTLTISPAPGAAGLSAKLTYAGEGQAIDQLAWEKNERSFSFRRAGPGWWQWYRLRIENGRLEGRFTHEPAAERPAAESAWHYLVSGEKRLSAAAVEALARLEAETGVVWVAIRSSPLVMHLHPRRHGPKREAGRPKLPRVLGEGKRPEAVAREFLESYRAIFGIADVRGTLVLDKVDVDDLGGTHVSFQQLVGAVPVRRAITGVHFGRDGAVAWAAGLYVPGLEKFDAAPTIDAAEALKRASAEVIAKHLPAGVRYCPGREQPPVLLITEEQPPRLIYTMMVDMIPCDQTYGSGAWEVDVDAKSGAILRAWDMVVY